MLSPYLISLQQIKLGIIQPVEKPKSVPIKKYSDKRKEKQKEYVKLVKEMLKESDRCEMKTPVCTGKAQGLQHKEKRSEKNLCDRKNLLRSCNPCNMYVEQYPLYALEHGLSISKHIKKSA